MISKQEQDEYCFKHSRCKIFQISCYNIYYYCPECDQEIKTALLVYASEVPPPIPKEAEVCVACNPTTMSEIWNTHTCKPKCDFCEVACGNEWCCMKDKK